MARDLYEIIGVRRDASQKEIETAYKKLALEFHPDRHRDNPLAPLAEERMKEINEAYSILKDPIKRRDYDAGELRGYSSPQENRTQAAPKYEGTWSEAPPQDEYAYTTDTGEKKQYTQSDASRIIDLQNRVVTLYNQGNYNSVAWLTDELLKLTPNDPEVYNIRGLSLMEMNKNQAALVAFNNAVRFNNRNTIYRFNRAVCYVSMRRPDMAVTDLNAANFITPNNPQILIGLAIAHHAMGKHLKAREYVQKAKFADPFHPAVAKYEAQRRQREMFRRNYYFMPGCSSSCTECLCLGMACDACCVPGGCCIL